MKIPKTHWPSPWHPKKTKKLSVETFRQWHPARLDEVIQKICTEFEPLTDDDFDVLAETYEGINVPADELSQSDESLRKLTSRFNRKTNKQLSGERLLSELLRLRKKGELPQVRR